MEKRKTTLRTVINELVERANTDTRRLRVLEEKVEELETRTNSLKDVLLQDKKQTGAHLDEIAATLKRQDASISGVEKALDNMVKQFKNVVTVSKIKELETLVSMYHPLKSNFVTKEELESMLSKRG
jgi:seryl-tRNA synthetase